MLVELDSIPVLLALFSLFSSSLEYSFVLGSGRFHFIKYFQLHITKSQFHPLILCSDDFFILILVFIPSFVFFSLKFNET